VVSTGLYVDREVELHSVLARLVSGHHQTRMT